MRRIGWEIVGVTFSQSEFIEGQLCAYPRNKPCCKREERPVYG